MVNKYWNLEDYSYDTMLAVVECYGVIEDPFPYPVANL